MVHGGPLEVHQRSFRVCQGACWGSVGGPLGLSGSVRVCQGPSGSIGVHCRICLGSLWDLSGSTPISFLEDGVGFNVRSLPGVRCPSGVHQDLDRSPSGVSQESVRNLLIALINVSDIPMLSFFNKSTSV